MRLRDLSGLRPRHGQSFADPIASLPLSPLRMSKQQQLAVGKVSSQRLSPLRPNRSNLQDPSTPGQNTYGQV